MDGSPKPSQVVSRDAQKEVLTSLSTSSKVESQVQEFGSKQDNVQEQGGKQVAPESSGRKKKGKQVQQSVPHSSKEAEGN